MVNELRSKLQKQRNEIGRLTRLTATLHKDKTDLLFDLNKLRKENEQLRAQCQTNATTAR